MPDDDPTLELVDVGDVAELVAAIGALTAALAPALAPATRPTWDQQRWAPGPDAFGPAAAPTAPGDVVEPFAGRPPHVVTNELIESAWGNAVVDDLTEAYRLFGERPTAFQNSVYTQVSLAWAAKFELVTTNASGGFTIGWAPYTFSSPPAVLINSAHDGTMFCNPTTIAVGGANAVARAAAGAPLANTPFYCNWAAFGLALH